MILLTTTIIIFMHNYIAAAIAPNTLTTVINKTTNIVKGYHDRSIPTYITTTNSALKWHQQCAVKIVEWLHFIIVKALQINSSPLVMTWVWSLMIVQHLTKTHWNNNILILILILIKLNFIVCWSWLMIYYYVRPLYTWLKGSNRWLWTDAKIDTVAPGASLETPSYKSCRKKPVGG
jgi:hypothetical protein